ncbi:hypothetical protein AALP_AA6G247000 [Arabis alpina]|uniref:Uncharacterized protein n=1 Tax=Arabis alpina TaxID=50452 RepID=A0A087GRH1_ARAAL|nr:hypothetical protein AALP_AA6G247000 [Arabis alpina]
MPSKSSLSTHLNTKRVRRYPNVTLAHASDYPFAVTIPIGIPLVGPSDRRSLGTSSHEVELPQYQPETAPPQGLDPSNDRPAFDGSWEDGSSNNQLEDCSLRTDSSDRINFDQNTSGGDKGSLVDFRSAIPKSPGPDLGHGIMLSDCNDIASSMNSTMVYALSPAGGWEGISIRYPEANDRHWSPPAGYMCVYECFIKNGGLYFPIPRLLLQYWHRRERQKKEAKNKQKEEVEKKKKTEEGRKKRDEEKKVKIKSAPAKKRSAQEALRSGDRTEKIIHFNTTGLPVELDHLYAGAMVEAGDAGEKDSLKSKVADLTSALTEAEEVKKKEVSRVEGQVAELKSSSKDAVARAVSEAKKKARKGESRARLAGYNAEAERIVLPSVPEDSFDDEAVKAGRNDAQGISSAESSDHEAERTEVDGRLTMAGKTPALTRAEIEEAANGGLKTRRIGLNFKKVKALEPSSMLRSQSEPRSMLLMLQLESRSLLSSPILKRTPKTRKMPPRSLVIR